MVDSTGRSGTLARFREFVFGAGPERDLALTADWIDGGLVVDGACQVDNLVLTFSSEGERHRVLLTVVRPAHLLDAPTVVALNFRGNHTVAHLPGIAVPAEVNAGRFWYDEHTEDPQPRGSYSSRWPLACILARGYAVATACYLQLGPDSRVLPRTGLYPMACPGDRVSRRAWSAIGMWAWLLSRIVDVLEEHALASQHIAFGHSRLGKTALWAAAQDARFAAVILNNSGAMGAAVPTSVGAETAALLAEVRPYWFNSRFVAWMQQHEEPPIGQEALLKAVAPRPLYIASASADHCADPAGEARAVQHVRDSYPTATVGYHLREGGHDVTAEDWSHFLDFLDVALTRSTNSSDDVGGAL